MAVGIGTRLALATRYQLGSRIGQSATLALSLRLINPSYSDHLVRVRRDSDDDEMDIYAVDGELDTVSLDSFCSGANGFATELKNQNDNLCCVTQSTQAKQPKIYDATTGVVLENGKPALSFDGVDDELIGELSSNPQPISIFSVQRPTILTGNRYLFNTGIVEWLLNSKRTMFAGTSVSAADAATNQELWSVVFNSTSSVFRSNSITVASGNTGTGFTTSALSVGSGNGGAYWQGTIQELIIYTEDKTAALTAIESDINNYYGVH